MTMKQDIASRSKLQSGILQISGKIPYDRNAAKMYSRIRGEFSDQLNSALIDWRSGRIGIGELRGRWTKSIKDFYPRAYQVGMQIGEAPWGMSSFDTAWVTGAVKEEMKYLEGFVRDIRDGKGIMPYEKRLQMYVNSLDSVKANGLFEAWPDRIKISWMLSPSEHCEDCIELSSNNPYTKYTLPTFPRAGETKCLCITTPDSRVLTSNGWVPIADIKVGDYVITHELRLKKVLATPRNKPKEYHKQGMIQSLLEDKFVGCTSDHLFLTKQYKYSESKFYYSWQSIYNMQFTRLNPSYCIMGYNKDQHLLGFGKITCVPRMKILGKMSKNKILYDLTVEDDHSFIVEGLIAHNSNCKCYLHVEVTKEPVRAPTDRQTVIRDRNLEKKLKTFQRPIPQGLRIPDSEEKVFLDGIFDEIYKLKRKIEVTTDVQIKMRLIEERRVLNLKAIEYADKRKIHYVRSWETPSSPGAGFAAPPKLGIPPPPIEPGLDEGKGERS